MSFTLTNDAVDVIKGLAAAPGAEGLRVCPAGQSLDTHGPGLQIDLAAGPQPEDIVVEAEGACIFLAPGALALMEGKVLDAGIEGREVHFALRDQTDEEAG